LVALAKTIEGMKKTLPPTSNIIAFQEKKWTLVVVPNDFVKKSNH